MTFMYDEAATSHMVVTRQLQENGSAIEALRDSLAADPPSIVAVCGRGSSGHAALYLRYVLETRLGILTTSILPSTSSVFTRWPSVPHGLCVTISQSGHSADLLAVVEGMKRNGTRSVALVNDTSSPLAELSQFVIPILAGDELSVAATKSFIGSLFASLQLVNSIKPGTIPETQLTMLPGLLKRAWTLDWTHLIDNLVNARGLYVIGRGSGLAIAGEAALKFKETCGLHAEAYSAAEVRHGPMALFKKDFPVLIFRQQDESAASIDEIATLAVEHGCKVFVVGGATKGAINLEAIHAPALLEPMLQIQSFYRAVNDLSLRRGRDPDRPPFLQKVTVTK